MDISDSVKAKTPVQANSAANRAQTEKSNPAIEQATKKDVRTAKITDQTEESRGSVNQQRVSAKTDTQKAETPQKEKASVRPQVSDDFARAVAQKFIKKEDSPRALAKETAQSEAGLPDKSDKSRDGIAKAKVAKL